MNNCYKLFLLLVLPITIIACKKEKHEFPIDKRYWDISDYEKAILELNYGYESDEKLPSFADPETRVIVEKLTDHENFQIVLDDQELGIKYRSEMASKFFNEWREMQKIYRSRDLQDNYVYDIEMLKVWQFGLGLQLKYFKLGNDDIIASSDDPNSSKVKSRLNSNVQTLIENFNIYLDEINNENAFSEEGKKLLAKGIDLFFTDLVRMHSSADFSSLKRKLRLMKNKSQSKDIKESLSAIQGLIEEGN